MYVRINFPLVVSFSQPNWLCSISIRPGVLKRNIDTICKSLFIYLFFSAPEIIYININNKKNAKMEYLYLFLFDKKTHNMYLILCSSVGVCLFVMSKLFCTNIFNSMCVRSAAVQTNDKRVDQP